MLIRKMKPEDVPQAAEIERECFSQPWSEKVYSETLANPSACYLVAELEEETSDDRVERKIIGTCGLMNVLGEADISNVAVRKAYRGRGIAGVMLQELIGAGREAGVETFFLEVRVSNIPAIRTYEKCGFQNRGLRRAFYENPTEDALIMKLEMENLQKENLS